MRSAASTTPVRLLLLGSVAAWTAYLTVLTALGKLVYDLTRRELDLGLLGVAEFAPVLALMLLSGSLADRRERRLVAQVGLGIQAVSATLLAVCAVGRLPLLAILAATVVLGGGRAVATPSIRALAADLVTSGDLPWVTARLTGSNQVGFVLGPVLAGALYAVGAPLPFVVAGALYILSASLLHRVRPPRTVRPPTGPSGGSSADGQLERALAGWRFIRAHPVLMGAITIDLLAVLAGGAVALLPAIAEVRLGVGPVGLGWLRAAIGIGAGAMIIVLARWPLRRRIGPSLFLSVAVFGLGTMVLGLTNSFIVAFAAVVLFSAADAVSMYIRSTLLPTITPTAMRGRVLAVELVFIGASNELGELESGAVGQWLGSGPAVVVGGLATLLVAVAWAALFPSLRRIDEFPSDPGTNDSR